MHVKHEEQSAEWSVGSLSYDDCVIYETKWKEEGLTDIAGELFDLRTNQQ